MRYGPRASHARSPFLCLLSSFMVSFIGSLLRAVPGPLRRAEQGKRAPLTTQRTLLRDLLRTAAGTKWGQRFDFAAIADAPDVVAAFQERVPLHQWEDICDDAARVRDGVPDVFWPGRTTNFAVSSGTTSEGKVMPISDATIAHNRSFSLGVGMNYLVETGHWQFLLGKHLTIPGTLDEDPERPGVLAGEVSGILAEHAPGFFRTLFQAVSDDVLDEPNWRRKLEAIADRAMDQDIRLMVMVPSWAASLFHILIERYNARHDTNVQTVGEIWPNLQVFISGGVALDSYRELLQELIGLPRLDFVETYGASEGFFAFQNEVHDPALLLHTNAGVFYEFVRMDELSSPNPTRYTLETIETGVRYATFVSNASGLWAYQVGDVVRFTQKDPYKIVVAGRTSEMIDKYGEALFGEEAREALYHACQQTRTHFSEFHLAPLLADTDRTPAHQWLVEFETPPDDLSAFADLIDSYLLEANRHYRIRREGDALATPEVVSVPPGTFHAWLRQAHETVSSQTKMPRMSEERHTADGILDLARNNA